jgi:hypothetical protein
MSAFGEPNTSRLLLARVSLNTIEEGVYQGQTRTHPLDSETPASPRVTPICCHISTSRKIRIFSFILFSLAS